MNKAWVLLTAAFFLLTLAAARAQSTSWDSALAGTEWDVPAQNLLAYSASGTNLTDLTAIADQTIWSITTCVSGTFSGTSMETFQLGPLTISGTSTMSGVVNDAGQIRIVFTESSGSQTVGIGQVKMVSGTTALQMQMLSGSNSSGFITHWANMEPYNGDPSTLPPLVISGTTIDQEWSWMEGTNWTFDDADLFGADGTGTFQVQGYDNGYFWGSGTGPDGSAAESYTLLGSATPEGTILFSLLSGTTLTSLEGQITGTETDGQMALRVYDTNGNLGDAGTATVVPEPSALALLGGGLLLAVAVGGRMVLRRKREAAIRV